MRLGPNVLGVHRANYCFQGSTESATSLMTFFGPTDRNVEVHDEFAAEDLAWSPCGAARNLVLNAEVRVNNSQNPQGSGIMTVDTLDGTVTEVYHLRWQRCW